MGVLVDTGVFIRWERNPQSGSIPIWETLLDSKISVITVSELLVGVWRADSEARRVRRQSQVDLIVGNMRVVEVTVGIARLHAELMAKLTATGNTIGAHDLWIAATALSLGDTVLTTNIAEFNRVPGLSVLAYPTPS
jgi:tRNA(fMet)-specific endonuclease VapC